MVCIAVSRATYRTQDYVRIRNSKASRDWQLANAEQYKTLQRVAQKRWRLANKEKKNAYASVYYWRDPDKFRARARQFAKEHLPQSRVRNRNRYARTIAAGGAHTVDDIYALYVKQQGCCVYCKVQLNDRYHADHKKALSKGGSNDILNIQLLCPPCNQRKHAKDPIVFAQSIGFLL